MTVCLPEPSKKQPPQKSKMIHSSSQKLGRWSKEEKDQIALPTDIKNKRREIFVILDGMI